MCIEDYFNKVSLRCTCKIYKGHLIMEFNLRSEVGELNTDQGKTCKICMSLSNVSNVTDAPPKRRPFLITARTK